MSAGGQDLGFAYTEARSGDVRITRHGREVTVLRGAAAERFLRRVGTGDPQQEMARVTGSYRMGNERRARSHPRNQR